MSSVLVSGSLAYDYLFTFPGVFQDELIDHNAGSLSVSFYITEKSVFFGGCSGNIVFNGKLLKEDFILFGIAGRDFGGYEKWLNNHGIDTSNVIIDANDYTSSANVVTDKKEQQITFFHGGAASKSGLHKKEIKKRIALAAKKTKLAIISPNDRNFILASIEGCMENRIPFIFDPGQAIPLFKSSELIKILKNASGLMLNEYELALFKKQTGMAHSEILRLAKLLVITLAEKGSKIHFQGKEIIIPAIKPKKVVDPTGCGDAFRAGFLATIKDSFPRLTPNTLKKAGQRGTRLALACLQSIGTQNHQNTSESCGMRRALPVM
ncbi:carbohydrate kinase family protein [Candidatus Peregrinibacteria bacterium]|nr:carbohydrate kinase family protein [Candidatus Peregrinibacteria bacterium]